MRDKLGAMLKAGDTVRLSRGALGTVVGEERDGYVLVELSALGHHTRCPPHTLVRTTKSMAEPLGNAEQFAPAEPSDTPEWFNEGEFWKSQFEAANRDARHYLQELNEKTRLLSDAMGLLSVAAPFMASKLKPSSDTKFEWAENMETLLNELESPE